MENESAYRGPVSVTYGGFSISGSTVTVTHHSGFEDSFPLENITALSYMGHCVEVEVRTKLREVEEEPPIESVDSRVLLDVFSTPSTSEALLPQRSFEAN